ncbi:MAG: hypothetical protein CM15mP74_14800 [Halieaceae bacterium]|nr:MAG: hypothetical protein CM15mP74_14800 [Halieaceae bacterium]
MKGVVLDLRNNPGGVLGASVDMAGALLDGGLVVYTEGRHPSPRSGSTPARTICWRALRRSVDKRRISQRV